ncbi:serine protease FAM111A-like [Seriola aureovittata]|uniref:serine protease FAM111A-like n=1 Tax=Seriola aureovittata TaxID=2871759 RepID=UPI0024BD6C04|nr:serine protease FAM111A-like [Seriola aureovittata]
MEPKLKTETDGPMDKTVENNTDDHNGESHQPRNLQVVAKGEESHATHSFKWGLTGKTFTSVTCNKAGTVEDSLKRSSQFKELAKKNNDKDLVVVADGRAISSHCPCSLIKDECLTVSYVKTKTVDKQKQIGSNGSVRPRRKASSCELVMFHVLTIGGKNVMKILRTPALKTIVQEITVYAYKGEKVKQALKRDGRFQKTIFKKNCALSHTGTHVTTEMSNLVDHLDGKTYRIILLNKANPPESLPGSLDDAYMMPNESQRSESDENQDPSQQTTTSKSVKNKFPKQEPNLNGNTAPEEVIREIPHSAVMQNQLSLQFKRVVKGRKTVSKLSRVQNLLRVEYGQNVQMCTEVKTMKKLMDLSNSVCHVRIKGSPVGSGFLLFDKFVLTNGHVIKDIYNDNRQLDVEITVHFSYESLDPREEGQKSGVVKVEEVAGFEYCPDVSGHMYDWALLRLSADQKLPDGLLKHFGFLPQGGGVCIIGHPYGGVKKIDPCVIIPPDNRNQVVEKSYHENQGPIHLVTRQFFEGVAEYVQHNSEVLTYQSCFYHGSSGSPVFDKYCRVVAMHSGGFTYPDARGDMKSVIEFGYRLSDTIEHIIVQLVERGSLDVLKAYLACSYPHHQDMMSRVKKLVESRNLTVFRNTVKNSEATNDESLKKFFDFFSQKEEPVPMDISDV